MCGINGIFHFSTKQVDEQLLVQMRDVQAHRGPDDVGLFIDGSLGLGHRRLSIIDTSAAGHQPFFSQDKRYCIVFNGEIYNYRSFYKELEDKGLPCRTGTDTEVLLKLYKLYGLDFLDRLKGMFAFAIWDTQEKKLVLARDRMGVKPLYYAYFDNSIFFASEQKALFTAGVPLEIEQEGLSEYFYNRFVAGENTMFKRVKKLLPGHCLTLGADGFVTSTRWWDLKEKIQNFPRITKPLAWFEETFYASVKYRMVADVPVGVLLSGGLDSSSIVAALSKQAYDSINAFTIGFDQPEHNEAYLAKKLSDSCGYIFHQLNLNQGNFLANLQEAVYCQDEPIMHLNEPHLLAIAKVAQQKVKVLLSGEGADELMGGYLRYKTLENPSLLRVLAALSICGRYVKNPRQQKLLRYATISKRDDLIFFNASNVFPKDNAIFYKDLPMPENSYRKAILADAKALYPGNLRRQALFFDQHTYLCSLLDRNDRCTMAASVECREPFLDEQLMVGLGTLSDQWLFKGKKGKFILKKSMQQVLPPDILDFRKIGLSAPWDTYLQYPDMRAEMEDFTVSPIFDWDILGNINAKKLVHDYYRGNFTLLPYIKALLMLHLWHKNYAQKFGLGR